MSQFAFSQLPAYCIARVNVVSGSPNNVTLDLGDGPIQEITVPTGLGTFTINDPIAAGLDVSNTHAGLWWIKLVNNSGGALTVTWPTSVKTGTIAYPADTKVRLYEFLYDGASHWRMNGIGADLTP